jgi:dTDP-6-deoxy-L-talose 4-dehydrogenase (NAD+)
VTEKFVLALENPQIEGIINCCNGRPITVLDLVKQRCHAKASNIKLNREYHPYPDYETMTFWSVPSK